MMDSMTNKELDSSDIKLWQTESRIMRIARGAGVHPQYVGELIGQPRRFAPAPHSMCSPSCYTECLQPADGRPVPMLGLPAELLFAPELCNFTCCSDRRGVQACNRVQRMSWVQGRALAAGEYVRIRTMIMGPGKGKGKGIMQQMGKMGKHGTMNPQNVQQMARMLPPQVRCLLHASICAA